MDTSAQGAEFMLFEYKLPRVTRVGKIVIKPGINRVSLGVARVLKHDKRWNYLVEHGQVVIRTGRVPDNETVSDATPKVPETLEGMSVKDAQDVIANTFDVELLEAFAAEDSRKGVHKAIEAQLAKLQKAGKPDTEGEDDPSKDAGEPEAGANTGKDATDTASE